MNVPLKLPARGDDAAPHGALTERSHVTARSGAVPLTARTDGRSEVGSLAADADLDLSGPIGSFIGTQASDEAKAMWSAYRSQLHSRAMGDAPPSLGLPAAQGNITQRLNTAPSLPKLGGADDPGRMVKDWTYYSYHPRASLACSLNQFGTNNNGRWPGLNHTPVTRHHLVLRPGTLNAKRELAHTVWTGHPALEAGPGEKPIMAKLKLDEAEARRRVREVARHREMLQQKMKARTQARVALEMLASQRPRP